MRKPFRGGNGHFFCILIWICFLGWDLGMCERVRTRNTLYEVGARKSKICYNAVEGRKMKKEKKEKKGNKIKIVNYENMIKLKY